MLFELLKDLTKMGLIVACLYLALGAYARSKQPAWSGLIGKRRLAILCVLLLAVTVIKVGEDVLAKESGPVDEAIMWVVRNHIPSMLIGFFEVVTVSGSSTVLVPLASAATVALFLAKRRREALLFAASVISAPVVVYVIKTAVGRARPALWETQWYWGSSFPSGHTLAAAAFSTAAALCVIQIWPNFRGLALSLALSWTVLVAVSRLVLGVHWPTDVLTAACIGAFIPLAISIGLDFRHSDHGPSDKTGQRSGK